MVTRVALIALALAGCAAPQQPWPVLTECEQLALAFARNPDSPEARQGIRMADCKPGSAVTVDVDRLSDDRFRVRVRP